MLPLPMNALTEAVKSEIYPAADSKLREVADANRADGLLVYLQGCVDENRMEEQLIETVPDRDVRSRRFARDGRQAGRVLP